MRTFVRMRLRLFHRVIISPINVQWLKSELDSESRRAGLRFYMESVMTWKHWTKTVWKKRWWTLNLQPRRTMQSWDRPSAEIKLTVINEYSFAFTVSKWVWLFGLDWCRWWRTWLMILAIAVNHWITLGLSMRFRARITVRMSWKHMPLNGNKIVLTGRKNTTG